MTKFYFIMASPHQPLVTLINSTIIKIGDKIWK